MSGGTHAAYGYRYQYLVTLEFFLRYLRDHLEHLGSTVLHVEPTSLAAPGVAGDEDIVDFAIEVGDEVILTAQVKSSVEPARNEVFPGEVKKVFGRLRPADATLAILVTNRPPSPGLAAQCVESSSNSACREWVYGEALQVPADAESGRRIIRQDNRSVEDLTASVASLVRAFRSDRHFSLGESTARLVSINLLYRIFGAAADAEPGGLSALKIVDLMTMPDAQVAHALGGFDWGLPVAGIPTFASTVPRVEHLNTLVASLAQEPEVVHPRVIVAHGQTGHGKSALAADFCHLYNNSFEFIRWIDCSDPT